MESWGVLYYYCPCAAISFLHSKCYGTLHVCFYMCMSFWFIFLWTVLRYNDISPQAKSGRLKDSYEDDPELTAQVHQTLADFDAELAGKRACDRPQFILLLNWIYIFSLRHPDSPGVHASNTGIYIYCQHYMDVSFKSVCICYIPVNNPINLQFDVK